MLRQRVYQIAFGYEDGDDCTQLQSNSIFKLCAGKLPGTDPDLASQPTMCRLENSVSISELYVHLGKITLLSIRPNHQFSFFQIIIYINEI